MRPNLFATVLTHVAPSSNYRGESEENRTVIQKISRDNHEYAVISPEAMRNALREILAGWGLPMNRSRLPDEDQLAVKYQTYPDASQWADDFLFGHLVADQRAVKANKGKPAKRDSVLRMNLAVATAPYRFDATFHQSPLAKDSPFQNAGSSALLHREVSYTAYQYPLALNGEDCAKGPREWSVALLKAVGELSDVAGGHARSLFEMAPRSIVVRLTPSLVAGYASYGFDADGSFRDLGRLTPTDLPPAEFWLGGEVVRRLADGEREALRSAGAHLYENPQRLLADVATAWATW